MEQKRNVEKKIAKRSELSGGPAIFFPPRSFSLHNPNCRVWSQAKKITHQTMDHHLDLFFFSPVSALHVPLIIYRLILMLLGMITIVGTRLPVLFQYHAGLERTPIQQIRWVWASVFACCNAVSLLSSALILINVSNSIFSLWLWLFFVYLFTLAHHLHLCFSENFLFVNLWQVGCIFFSMTLLYSCCY